ncbi:hypothetical protein N5K21_25320 [Rhizobium pusense]|uniref:Uncharacterized protein n=1 Tax=Agrobacterium pusense TaxID=648995 RepID=A0A6H0ZP19_9HYPH|nr:hypothetical protein [Agrobacterium pusense]MDH2092051.1 hypothetical protein [Agrobacterium pusense]QIX22592.1 hypothetical protein FOB41_16300 [Agrobacterium pusense]WCK24503.1 hypothetical protein CFBP5496_0002600 [Agrobacterium pusense]
MTSLFTWEDHPYGSFGYLEDDPANPRLEIQRNHLDENRIHIGVITEACDGKRDFFIWTPIHEGVFRTQEDAKAHAPRMVAQWLWQNRAAGA